MSWSASVGPIAITNLEEGLATATTSPPTLSLEPLEQFEQAKAAAMAIAGSGAVGDPTRAVFVTLSGHGNPGHVPAVGWANDCVTVSVTQATVSA